MAIEKATLQFLKDLGKNNDREWFNDNKERFNSANQNFIDFVRELIDEVANFDKSVGGLDAKNAVFRIYRDIRFSKDKSPYKTHFGATLLGKGKGCGIAGYYIHLEPSNSFLAGGVHMTEPRNLIAIRTAISNNDKEFLTIVKDKKFKTNFTIEGEKLVKIPRGFDKEDTVGEYLRFKELTIRHRVPDNEIISVDFTSYCSKIFRLMVPFNSFINEAAKSLK
jgi:uncharacterized protein (TIGR02453 family)